MSNESHEAKHTTVSAFKRDGSHKTLDEIVREFLHSRIDLNRDDLNTMKANFEKLDKDGDLVLNFFEVAEMLESLGETKTHVEIRQMIADIDSNNDGTVDFAEFVQATRPAPPEPGTAPIEAPLFGRIVHSSLFVKAKFFEEKIAALKAATAGEEEVRRKQELKRLRREEEQKLKEEEERKKKEEADRKAAFKAKNEAMFGAKKNE